MTDQQQARVVDEVLIFALKIPTCTNREV